MPYGLTHREREVLLMTAYGLSGQQIADWLHVKCSTVYWYRYRIGRKFHGGMLNYYTARELLRLPYRERPRRRRRAQTVE
jgi:FixJ family two-component response regulator